MMQCSLKLLSKTRGRAIGGLVHKSQIILVSAQMKIAVCQPPYTNLAV